MRDLFRDFLSSDSNVEVKRGLNLLLKKSRELEEQINKSHLLTFDSDLEDDLMDLELSEEGDLDEELPVSNVKPSKEHCKNLLNKYTSLVQQDLEKRPYKAKPFDDDKRDKIKKNKRK